MWPPHIAAAFILYALVTALGCDENAPTETRTPSAGRQSNLASHEADAAALGDISAMAIALPVNQSVSTTAPSPAFRINQTGSGPNGIFRISPSTNAETALEGVTSGLGRAGLFRIQNTGNAQPALQAQTNGDGVAVKGLATGCCSQAALFQISSSTNSNTALTATTNGAGNAGFFRINLPISSFAALNAQTNGRGAAILGLTTGSGLAATFQIQNTGNSRPALVVNTNGTGPAGLFEVFSGNQFALKVSAPTNAARFLGNVNVQGTLTKTAGSFRIDHPLDPEHKYLSHSFVESPDMMNVYNGNVTLDASGRATVELPDYFEALNRDFRYQLTAIGAPGPNLYIAEGVKQNRFRIAGGRAHALVSWQVTGVRQDPYANAHRVKVEEVKQD